MADGRVNETYKFVVLNTAASWNTAGSVLFVIRVTHMLSTCTAHLLG